MTMEIVVGREALTPAAEGAVVTVGTFDGVHLGHRALIAETISIARATGRRAVGVTWDRHPAMTLRPDKAPPMLSTQERKLELLSETGLDRLIVLVFDKELSQVPAERFVDEILVRGIGMRHIVSGSRWRFGHKAKGNVDLLTELAPRGGFEVTAMELASLDGEPVSSSRTRGVVAAGDMTLAARLLGRPFDLDGVVIHGDDRGASLGFPTANLALDPTLIAPLRGVYAGRARVSSNWYGAATNVGVNPTFGGDPDTTPMRVETFLLDFAGDIYGEQLRVTLEDRLRDELAFESTDALIAQIEADVGATRAFINRC
jgi:riboflavin kinase/FMN adenylyltransferase